MDKIDGFLSAKINGKSEEKAENEVKVTRRRTAQRKTAARKSPLKNEKAPLADENENTAEKLKDTTKATKKRTAGKLAAAKTKTAKADKTAKTVKEKPAKTAKTLKAEKTVKEKTTKEKAEKESGEKEKKTAGKNPLQRKKREKTSSKKSSEKKQGASNIIEAARNLFRAPEKTGNEHIRIIPLGGLEQIGMNITAFEDDDSIVVVDCGLAFPGDDMLGVDLVIPDVTYLKQNIEKVKGFVITHGHEDHIGALPYILRDINVPVYSTRLTIALIENKLREVQLLDSAKLNVVKHGDVVRLGSFDIEFIKTNHSIQDASALAIHSPAGTILHTGDFKVDYTPVFGDAIDLQRFAELGRDGVLALMADSTNALRQGFTMSERTVGRTFDAIFAEHPKNRIIVATFASNVDRVQQVINDAYKYDRKVVVEGRSMVNVIGTASELGYISIPEGTLIDIDNLKDYPEEKTVIVTTGSQGESMAALSRMASSQHRKVSIGPNDVVVLSSTPIPGNEKAVARVINELSQKHAEVIYQDTHVSGHACQEELKLIYSLVHPKYAIPVHGEYRHRLGQTRIAQAVGIPKENIIMASTGDVIDIGYDSCKIVDHVQSGGLMVDGLGVGDVGNIVLRDRQNLAQNGIIVVVLTLEKYSGHVLSGPDIVTRGFVYVRESETLIEEARGVVRDAVDDCLVRHVSDWGKIKNVIKDSLSDYFWKKLKRNPMILPIIMEV